MRTPSSAYDQLRVSGFPPVRLGSWHRYRSLSQEFNDVFKPEASSIAREPAVRPRDPLTELLVDWLMRGILIVGGALVTAELSRGH